MRVVHVCKVKGIAGAEGHLLILLPALAARGVDVRMIVLDTPAGEAAAFSEALGERGVAVERIATPRHVDVGLVGRLAARLRELRPDVVHTHLLHADLYGLAAARRCGVRASVSSRHDNSPFRRRTLVRLLNRRAMRHADRIVAISDAVARFAVSVERADPEKVSTIYYGLPAMSRNGSPPPWPHAPGPLVAVVARLVEQKGIEVLLDAFALLRARRPDARLVVIGDGPLRPALVARTERQAIAAATTFTGWIDNARHVMPHADVIVVPSRWEGLGLVALEAMAAARPVVASAVDALPEIVEDGRTGVLVPPADPVALAAVLGDLLDRPDWARQLGEAGRRRVAERFTVEAMTDATLRVYEEALAKR